MRDFVKTEKREPVDKWLDAIVRTGLFFKDKEQLGRYVDYEALGSHNTLSDIPGEFRKLSMYDKLGKTVSSYGEIYPNFIQMSLTDILSAYEKVDSHYQVKLCNTSLGRAGQEKRIPYVYEILDGCLGVCGTKCRYQGSVDFLLKEGNNTGRVMLPTALLALMLIHCIPPYKKGGANSCKDKSLSDVILFFDGYRSHVSSTLMLTEKEAEDVEYSPLKEILVTLSKEEKKRGRYTVPHGCRAFMIYSFSQLLCQYRDFLVSKGFAEERPINNPTYLDIDINGFWIDVNASNNLNFYKIETTCHNEHLLYEYRYDEMRDCYDSRQYSINFFHSEERGDVSIPERCEIKRYPEYILRSLQNQGKGSVENLSICKYSILSMSGLANSIFLYDGRTKAEWDPLSSLKRIDSSEAIARYSKIVERFPYVSNIRITHSILESITKEGVILAIDQKRYLFPHRINPKLKKLWIDDEVEFVEYVGFQRFVFFKSIKFAIDCSNIQKLESMGVKILDKSES